jgi:hypothetical protein
MADILSEQQRAFLEANHSAVMATVDDRGRPLAVPVLCALVDGQLWSSGTDLFRRGDQGRADAVYTGVEPLTADDIADSITWAVTRPPHVDIDVMVVRPVAQAASYKVARNLP